MTPETLLAMSTEDLRAQLAAAATERYGARWQAALAREFGYSRRAVHNWTLAKPPIEMIIALRHLQQRRLDLADLAKLAQLAKLTAERLEAKISQISSPSASENAPSETAVA